MKYDFQRADLSAVVAEARLVADETRRIFGKLSSAQINWKPGQGEWSIGQCFDHLIIANRPYFPIIEEIRQSRKRRRLRERLPWLPGLFGKMIIKTLQPDSGRKVKARRQFLPSSSVTDPGIIGAFLDQQERLVTEMEATRGLDLERITITSPILSLITYSLMDAYRIIVVHEQNHFVQARRVLEAPGFPT
jgi:hypothetical protein